MSSKPAAPSEATHGRRVDPLGARRPQRGGAHSGNYAARPSRAHAYGSAVGSADELLAEASGAPDVGLGFHLARRSHAVRRCPLGLPGHRRRGRGRRHLGPRHGHGRRRVPVRRDVASARERSRPRGGNPTSGSRQLGSRTEPSPSSTTRGPSTTSIRSSARHAAASRSATARSISCSTDTRRTPRRRCAACSDRGGRFLTQQADSAGADARAPARPRAVRKDALRSQDRHDAARGRGLDRAGRRTARVETLRFADIGAFAWYLRMIPWTVPGFTIDGHRAALERLHDAGEPIVLRGLRFWIDRGKRHGLNTARRWDPRRHRPARRREVDDGSRAGRPTRPGGAAARRLVLRVES